MRSVLMVAEKPSLALSIAKILSRGALNSRKGLSNACSVHEYSGKFQGDMVLFKVTSVCGHVMALDFEGKYNNWEKVDPSELFLAPTYKKESNPKLNIIKFLEKEARNVDSVVLWLDCDKEGENICFEVLDIVLPIMKSSGASNKQNVFRAHFSAITDKDIHAAMNSLGSPNENEALSVDARQELDLRVGCAFTRFQTKYFQGKYGNLDSSLISYGPCQTPTLGFCVERHDKIQSFKPETFWQIDVDAKCPDDGPSIRLDWARVRVFDQHVANMYLSFVKDKTKAVVQAVKSSEKKKARPNALNTVELLRTASSALGIGPQQTMQIAEQLYTQGYISYPRTETTHYPENFDFRAPLNQQTGSSSWGQYAKMLLQNGPNKPKKGHDAGDHPPITPMRSASENELGHDHWRLYDYIVRHFLATLSDDCTYLHTEIVFKIGDETFTCTGNAPLKPGFTEVMQWQSITDHQTVPKLNKGDECPIEKVYLTEKKTGPPDYLTESELISLMEKHGIGTDASIPTHINNIVQRNYVTVVPGRKLQPTNLGIVLVHGYKKIDPDLALPTMRSAVEKQLSLISQGKAHQRDVLKHATTIFQQKFHFFVDKVLSMDKLFEVSFTPLSESGKSMSRCGKCRRFMKFIATAPPRLHCSTCDETYDLPARTNIKLYKELKCPLDEFELLMCSTGTQGKNYTLCPYCYNHPPFRDMKRGSGCNACTHPGCIHSRYTLGVASCISCENGILVLDMASAPKWKMACNDNRCSTVVQLFENAHRITVTEEACEKCSAYELSVDFHKDKTPLETKETKHTGCVFCDDVFSNLIKLKQARLTVKRPPSNRGRGRGRSRGRGRKAPKDKMSQLAAYFV
uniref:DNA topoisomerase n=1 Tax=Phallusia mammillata TaxID=59560 RepID=A0A6F9DVH1_9ASCI|nr:DNA topoisomerase 3-beta-1 [Phallusia mammillata]